MKKDSKEVVALSICLVISCANAVPTGLQNFGFQVTNIMSLWDYKYLL